MTPDSMKWTAIVIGLVLGAVLVLGGYVSGEGWVQFAGGVLGVGSGGAAVVVKRNAP